MCESQSIGTTEGKVQVRAFKPPSSQSAFLVQWGPEGHAAFHRGCWDSLIKHGQVGEVEKSMVTEARKTAEYHDGDAEFQKEAKRIADMIMTSTHCIAFTGAGISTAAGIGDFRGIDGKWTDREKKQNYGASSSSKSKRNYRLQELRPTYTHEAIAHLTETDNIKFVISQNTDGLHRLSGIPAGMLSELHGNAFANKCEKCNTWVDLPTRQPIVSVPPKKCPRCNINHRTGRMCLKPGCGGYMMNTIINFGDFLEDDVLNKAQDSAKRADLVLCLGTTLRVSPANSLVEMAQAPLRLIICNRQVTPYDEDTRNGSRVYGDCDRLMKLVMSHILPCEQLEEWEGRRPERMAKYDSLRK
ncbi:hypothetical protein ScPMuIL_003810 [Solemya velum]